MGNVYQCCAGHLQCSVCFNMLGGALAMCPTCSQQMSHAIRVRSLEKYRDNQFVRARAQANMAAATTLSSSSCTRKLKHRKNEIKTPFSRKQKGEEKVAVKKRKTVEKGARKEVGTPPRVPGLKAKAGDV